MGCWCEDRAEFCTCTESRGLNLGWHVISGERLSELLRRASEGEDPKVLYIEEYANAEHELVEADE